MVARMRVLLDPQMTQIDADGERRKHAEGVVGATNKSLRRLLRCYESPRANLVDSQSLAISAMTTESASLWVRS